MSYFVNVRGRGTIALPPDLRRKFRLDQPGAQVEVVAEGDHLVLRPHIAIPSGQAWFWEPEWQEGEGEASAQLAAGEGTTFHDGKAFVSSLQQDASAKPSAS